MKRHFIAIAALSFGIIFSLNSFAADCESICTLWDCLDVCASSPDKTLAPCIHKCENLNIACEEKIEWCELSEKSIPLPMEGRGGDSDSQLNAVRDIRS